MSEIKLGSSISAHYNKSLTNCAKNIEGAKKTVSNDDYTNCTSVTTPKDKYTNGIIHLVDSYASKLKEDVRNFDKACKELQKFDYKVGRNIISGR